MACCYNCTKRDYPHCYETCEDYLAEKRKREQIKKEREVEFLLENYSRERSYRIQKVINRHKKK